MGGYLFEFARARAYQGNVGITQDGEVFERSINRKRLGITLGVLGGIGLPVNRDDLGRFDRSLKSFGKTKRPSESGTSGRLSFHEVVAFSHVPTDPLH